MKSCWILLVGLACLLGASVPAAQAKEKVFKRFTGTWSCPVCDAKHLQGNQTECEAQGHKHALKLDDGRFVRFEENERSQALIQGGGRHAARIEIYGFYDEGAKTLDVECYKLDGRWSSWCSQHQRMDHCRGQGSPQPSAEAR
jgi:hypothetical protein